MIGASLSSLFGVSAMPSSIRDDLEQTPAPASKLVLLARTSDTNGLHDPSCKRPKATGSAKCFGILAYMEEQGKVAELRQELTNPGKKDKNHAAKKNALKKIVANMTMSNNDMVALFPDIISCMQIPVLEIKKMYVNISFRLSLSLNACQVFLVPAALRPPKARYCAPGAPSFAGGKNLSSRSFVCTNLVGHARLKSFDSRTCAADIILCPCSRIC